MHGCRFTVAYIVFDVHSPTNPREYPHRLYTLYFLETTIIGLNFAADYIGLPSLKFYGGLRKFCFFFIEWHFGRSKSSKVIDFGTNRKRVCDFRLVRHSNLGPILDRFGDIAGVMCSWSHRYSTLILGVFPLNQIAHVGVSLSKSLKPCPHWRLQSPNSATNCLRFHDFKLFGREIIFEVFQPVWKTYLNVTYRRTDRQTDWRTDGQTTYCGITALCIAISRGKKGVMSAAICFECKLYTSSEVRINQLQIYMPLYLYRGWHRHGHSWVNLNQRQRLEFGWIGSEKSKVRVVPLGWGKLIVNRILFCFENEI